MRRARRVATAMATALLLAGAARAGAAAPADASRGEVRFVAKESEVELKGSFRRFSADVDLDPARPQEGRIRVAIDLASADAGGIDADNLLRSKEFFDVARFPTASFEARTIRAAGDGRFEASGAFTLKGRSANLVLPFTVRRDGAGTLFEGATTISRLAFGVGEGQWSDTATLEDAVLIEFRLRVVH